jgi:hypothetical protein
MNEIFFLSDILFTRCYFTCTCLVLEISLFGSIVVFNIVVSFYIWHSDPYTELGQKTARCESLRALLPYVEWDRFVTHAGSKSGLRVTLSYLGIYSSPSCYRKFEYMKSSFCPTFSIQVAISRAFASFWRYPYLDRLP